MSLPFVFCIVRWCITLTLTLTLIPVGESCFASFGGECHNLNVRTVSTNNLLCWWWWWLVVCVCVCVFVWQ